MVTAWASLVGRRVAVDVPATIANLGAGFDCLGVAVDLGLRVALTVGPAGPIRVEVDGEGAGEVPLDRGNRFVEALEAGLREREVAVPPDTAWDVAMTNAIPVARGLGSSGAATVAGLLAAEALAGRGPARPERDRLLAAATRIEGHADNVAPALLGGLVASLVTEEVGAPDGSRVAAYRFEAPAGLRVIVFIPERRLSTAAMRALLPPQVPRHDAVANLARATVAMAGIASGDWTALRHLGGDRLHEPYRAAAYPELPGLVSAALAAGALSACLAGAGSSVAAFTLGDAARAEAVGAELARAAAAAGLAGRAAVLAVRNDGARILEP